MTRWLALLVVCACDQGVEAREPVPPPPPTRDAAPATPPGEIRGIVRTSSGEPINGASIVVSRRSVPMRLTTTSDTAGLFALEAPPGEFQIAVSMPGFHDQVIEGYLDSNAVLVRNYELRPAR